MFDDVKETIETMKQVSKNQRMQLLNSAALSLTRFCFEFKVTPKEAVKKFREINKELGLTK